VFDSETEGERGQILTISTRISGIRKEKAGKYGPLSLPLQPNHPKSDRLLGARDDYPDVFEIILRQLRVGRAWKFRESLRKRGEEGRDAY
jgi:hypothetical protein